MPDPGNPISGLYPQPNQNQPTSLLSDPLKALSALSSVQNMQIQRQQFQSQLAGGQAFQSALRDDGSIDPAALSAGLRAPAAALAAPEMVQRGLNAQGSALDNYNKNIQNGSAALSLASQNNGAMGQFFNGVNDVSDAGLAKAATQFSRLFPTVPPNLVHAAISGVSSIPPNQTAKRKAALAQYGQTATPVTTQNTPTEVTDPNTGQPSIVPQHTVITAGGTPTKLSPQAVTDISEYTKDNADSANTVANLRPLTQALPLIQKLANTEFGPTSPEFTKAKATLASLGVIDPNTSDGAVRQEVGKYLLRYSSQAQSAGRSDQALSAAMGSNPNADTMMKPAVVNLVRNQIGMDRMDAARPQAIGNPQGYLSQGKKTQYNSSVDPRAFSFDLMSPSERADLQKSLGSKGSPAYQKFVNSYTIAKQTGMLQPPGQ